MGSWAFLPTPACRSIISEVKQKAQSDDYASWLVKLKQKLKNFKDEAKEDLEKEQQTSEQPCVPSSSESGERTKPKSKEKKKKTKSKTKNQSTIKEASSSKRKRDKTSESESSSSKDQGWFTKTESETRVSSVCLITGWASFCFNLCLLCFDLMYWHCCFPSKYVVVLSFVDSMSLKGTD